MNANDSPHHGDHTRQERMRSFLKEHYISLNDMAEQFSRVMPERSFDRNSVYAILYVNKTIPLALREHMLDLGFPEDSLPPVKPVAQFPGLAGREAGAATA